MTKRFLVIGFAVSVVLIGLLVIGLAQAPQEQAPTQGQAAQGGGRGQRGPAAPPAPCGPNIGGDFGKNTAANSRCFELRMYTPDPARDGQGNFKGGINELHQRFREKEVELFKKNGAEVLGVWQNVSQPTLVYMLAFRDRAHRDEVWAAFNKDPEWNTLRLKYNVPLQPPNVTFLSATDYSPMK